MKKKEVKKAIKVKIEMKRTLFHILCERYISIFIAKKKFMKSSHATLLSYPQKKGA